VPLAKQFLPTCKPQLHLREEAYHWRNSPCPPATHSYISGRKHTTGETVLAHLQTKATCPGGSIPLAERSLPTCKPQLHVQEEAYHWRNGPCPPATSSTDPGRRYFLTTCNFTKQVGCITGQLLERFFALLGDEHCPLKREYTWQPLLAPQLPSGEKTSPVHNHIPHEPQCLYVPSHPISLAS
jgi:hypothetical protein